MKTNGLKLFFNKTGPAVTLAVLALAIPEILMGSTPFSHSEQWILEFFFYASGALLVREVAVKPGKGWMSVVLLGIAFGLAEEGIILQSVFNPRFLGLDLSYGRACGVNWMWAQNIIGYHAVYSISLPVFFSHLIFRKKENEQWLSPVWLGIIVFIFAVSSIAFFMIFYNMSGYLASPLHFILTAVLIILIVFSVFKLRYPQRTGLKGKLPPNFIIGMTGVVGGSIWLAGMRPVFIPGFILSPWIILIAVIVFIIIVSIIVNLWIKKPWNYLNRLFILSGLLISGLIHGFDILIQAGNKADVYFETACSLLLLVLLFVFGKILIRETKQSQT